MGWAANSLFLIFLSPGFAISNSKHHCFLKQKTNPWKSNKPPFLAGWFPFSPLFLSEGLSSSKTSWWFQRLFIFTPKIGEDEPIMTSISAYLSKGLVQPPTGKVYHHPKGRNCHFCKWRTCRLQGKWFAALLGRSHCYSEDHPRTDVSGW